MPISPTDIRNWSIYKIVNPKNRVYIGITTDLPKRIKHYQRADCRNQQALFNSLKKYGFSGHTFEVIETFTSDKDFAMGREIYWIFFYKCNYSQLPEENGLNLTAGGRGSHGRVMTEETKEKLRQANLGKKVSDETRAKISAIHKGKPIKRIWTQEQRDYQSKLKKGVFKHTDEAKRKISEAGVGNKNMLGRKQTENQKKKMSEIHTGNKYNLGRKQSEEERARRGAKLHKPVYKYSLTGIFLEKYISVKDAIAKTGLSRWQVLGNLTGRLENPKHFIFKYKPDLEFHKFQFQRRVFKIAS